MRAASLVSDQAGDTKKIIDGIEYKRGDKVMLRLSGRGTDAMDMMMDNKMATVEIMYTDYEDHIHIAVTLDDDPGQDIRRDLGLYLYFKPNEIELI